jgi:hypothetical protein
MSHMIIPKRSTLVSFGAAVPLREPMNNLCSIVSSPQPDATKPAPSCYNGMFYLVSFPTGTFFCAHCGYPSCAEKTSYAILLNLKVLSSSRNSANFNKVRPVNSSISLPAKRQFLIIHYCQEAVNQKSER